ncbi:M48 family metallopeptidase [Polaribacter cellanae]|uniref:M48 family metalloprotease n=1 Tax=Polaribacter cellanae TaxID=2818493 RepID=A0A975H6X2_9FLAO|nr:M48 family metalloprotease [Polaribacter cellanae]QTE22379.1 M48 family metalloprotease [Polaribacter cellanae]
MIKNAIITIGIVFVILGLQHIVLFLISKERKRSQLKEHLISVIGAAIFIGIPLSFLPLLMPKIANNISYLIIIFILLSSIIVSYWFVINPLKYVFRPNKFTRDNLLEEEIQREGCPFKIYFTNMVENNAFATGIIPFYKIIVIGNNLKEELSKEELKAVIYHEIGHHKNKHILKLFVVSVILQTFVFLLFFKINQIHFTHAFMEPIMVGINGAFIGFVFYYVPSKISYQFEYQADNYAANKYSKIATIGALKRLDEISNGVLTKGNATHPKLEKRLQSLEKNES